MLELVTNHGGSPPLASEEGAIENIMQQDETSFYALKT